MLQALLAKELRALRPIALLIVGFIAAMVVLACVLTPPDQIPFHPPKWLGDDRLGAFIMLMVFGMMTGGSLLLSEEEQGTLRFLDGLPITRSRIFIAKAVAGVLVIAVVPLMGITTDGMLGWLARTSVDGPFAWRFALTQICLQAVAGMFIVSLAMFLSFSRGWFMLTIGLLLWGYLWLREHGHGWIELLDPHALLGVGLKGDRVLVPWRHLTVQAGASLGLFSLSCLAFQSLGKRFHGARRQRTGRLRGLLIASLRWVGPILLVLAIVRLLEPEIEKEATAAAQPLGEQSFGRQETEYYEFLYRTEQWEDAAPLIGGADDVHQSVADFFGIEGPAGRIVVDLASPVMSHAAGLTNWTKIRMPLDVTSEYTMAERVLRHETAHVFIEQLGGGTLARNFKNVRFLHEGVATYLEVELADEKSLATNYSRTVAAVWSRGQVPFALLCDDETLTEQRDPNVVYPLGLEFARALIETHGEESPTRLLEAFARRGDRVGLQGTELWRDVMQTAGLDYERVIAAYEASCASITKKRAKFLARLPRLTGALSEENGEVILRASYDGKAPGKLVCFVEDGRPFAPPIRPVPPREDGSFVVTSAIALDRKVKYLLGWRTPRTEMPILEPWVEKAP